MTQIQEDSLAIIKILAECENEPNDPDKGTYQLRNEAVARLTNLTPQRINTAAHFLKDQGLLKMNTSLGTHPYNFLGISLTPQGLNLYQKQSENGSTVSTEPTQTNTNRINPIGSPYGFTDRDWEFIERKRTEYRTIRIAFGHQFQSEYYDSDLLKENLSNHFSQIVSRMNREIIPKEKSINLEFIVLSAGYGEHLFNEIARDIISSDIAIFETSDSNPNVMIELGVALTWGIRVLPILSTEAQRLPSDISGQTYIRYKSNAKHWEDNEHEMKVVKMIERALKKKGSI